MGAQRQPQVGVVLGDLVAQRHRRQCYLRFGGGGFGWGRDRRRLPRGRGDLAVIFDGDLSVIFDGEIFSVIF